MPCRDEAIFTLDYPLLLFLNCIITYPCNFGKKIICLIAIFLFLKQYSLKLEIYPNSNRIFQDQCVIEKYTLLRKENPGYEAYSRKIYNDNDNLPHDFSLSCSQNVALCADRRPSCQLRVPGPNCPSGASQHLTATC